MQHTRSCDTHNGWDGVIPSEKERKQLHAAATTREPTSIIILDVFLLVSIFHGRAEGKKVTAPFDIRRARAGCLLLVCQFTVDTGLLVHPFLCICDACLPCFSLGFGV